LKEEEFWNHCKNKEESFIKNLKGPTQLAVAWPAGQCPGARRHGVGLPLKVFDVARIRREALESCGKS